jgi:hypothetical protein
VFGRLELCLGSGLCDNVELSLGSGLSGRVELCLGSQDKALSEQRLTAASERKSGYSDHY